MVQLTHGGPVLLTVHRTLRVRQLWQATAARFFLMSAMNRGEVLYPGDFGSLLSV